METKKLQLENMQLHLRLLETEFYGIRERIKNIQREIPEVKQQIVKLEKETNGNDKTVPE